MGTNLNKKTLSQLVAVAACAAAIKLYYSASGVDDLFWVLAPTTWLVEFATGVKFIYESNAGYMSADHSFQIAASCSGVNFLITAFLMMALAELWRNRPRDMRWHIIPLTLGVAYVTTIIANTVRITTAMYMRHDPQLIWVNPDELHRLEGIVVYFGILLLLYFVIETSGADRRPRADWYLLRRSIFPLMIYYATTLGIPAVNLAIRSGPIPAEFWSHCLFVLFTPILLLLPLAFLGFAKAQRNALSFGRLH